MNRMNDISAEIIRQAMVGASKEVPASGTL